MQGKALHTSKLHCCKGLQLQFVLMTTVLVGKSHPLSLTRSVNKYISNNQINQSIRFTVASNYNIESS